MGQNSSSEDTAELERFSTKLDENRTLPLNLCFIVQTNGEKRDFISKIGEIVCILDNKHICSRNIYALLLNDYELKMVTFCNREKFLDEIKPIIASANNRRGITYASNTNDIYQKAFDYLVWKSSNRIVVKLNLTKTKPSEYELRMRANHNVDFFDIKSLESLDLLIEKFQNIDSKKIENKLTPKDFNFTSSTSEVCKYKARRISLKPGSNIINQKFLSTLETSSQLKQLQSRFLKEDCEIEIEKNPFSKGKEVYCFKGSYRDPRNPGKNNPKVFKLSQYEELNIEDNFIAQLIASFLAREYTKTLGNQYIIGYSEPSLIVVKVDGKERIYLMEDFCEGDFVKFTSNAVMMPVTDYTLSEKYVIDFSHWSHEFTEKKLMVVDLQGWQIDENLFCLTDPAIHSEAGKVFGKTDMGRLGFNRYYAFHKNICVLKDWFPLNDQKNELNEQKRESPNEPNLKETEKTDAIPLKQGTTTNYDNRTITNNTTKSSKTTILDPKSTKTLKSSSPINQPKANSPKCLKTINNNNNNNNEEIKIENFPATTRENWNSNDFREAILPLEPNINNGSNSEENSPKDNIPSKTANNKTIPIENFPNQLIPSELLKITKTVYEELLDLDKALANESLKEKELIEVIKQIGKILLKLSSKERHQNSWKAHSETLINILLDTYKRIYDKHKNKTLNFDNKNQFFVNHALDVMYKSAVQLYFLLGHSNPQVKCDLVKNIIYYHMRLNFNNFMNEFQNESVPKYEQFIRIAGDDKYLGDFKQELKKHSDNYKKLQNEISKKEATFRTTTATITTTANSNGDHSTREPYRRWQKFQVKYANSNEQCREEKAIKLVILAINDVVKELNLQTSMNQIDFSNWVMKLDDISKKIENCQPGEKIFWIERALKKILKVHSRTYDMNKKSIEKNDLENTYNTSSMLILLCEMAIEIYEIFQSRLNHEFTKAIIQIINDVQVNLLVRTSDNWEIWMAYFINFIERHQPS